MTTLETKPSYKNYLDLFINDFPPVQRTFKYNPSFLGDDQIVMNQCVRETERDEILNTLSEPAGDKPHTIVLGERGMGKSHLLRTVLAHVRSDEKLRDRYYPIVFPEESYDVSDDGDFWLEGLFRLTRQAPHADQTDLTEIYKDLRMATNNTYIAERCIETLDKFAENQEKRLLLIVENLNMFCKEVEKGNIFDKLSNTLGSESKFTVLASATFTRPEIDDPKGLFSQFCHVFNAIELKPLDTEQSQELWKVVSGIDKTPDWIKPIEILTGGNPRLIVKTASAPGHRSLHQLVDSLLMLIDDHTEYFKSNLDELAEKERKIYVNLAKLWHPVTAKLVADEARININTTSALLRRLSNRGLVTITPISARRKLYSVSDRLYNIYYLYRYRGGKEKDFDLLIDFMDSLYLPGGIEYITDHKHYTQPDQISSDSKIHEHVYTATLYSVHPAKELVELELRLNDLLNDNDLHKVNSANDLRDTNIEILDAMLRQAFLFHWIGKNEQAIQAADKTITHIDSRFANKRPEDRFVQYKAAALLCKGHSLTSKALTANEEYQNKKHQEAIDAYSEALEHLTDLDVSVRKPVIHPKYHNAGRSSALNDSNSYDNDRDYTRIGAPFSYSEIDNWLPNSILESRLDRQIIFTRFGKATAHIRNNETDSAIIELDHIIDRAKNADINTPGQTTAVAILIQKFAADSLALKYIYDNPQYINEAIDVLNALLAIVEQFGVTALSLQALVEAAKRIGYSPVLNAILNSGTKSRLLPLVVALQQEMGESRDRDVAFEVNEVANDIKCRLRET